MECNQALEWMMAALDDALDPCDRVTLEEHLTRCADCRADWERLLALDELLRAAPTAYPSAGFAGRVMARVDRRRRVRHGVVGGGLLTIGALVAAALVFGPALALLIDLSGLIGDLLPYLRPFGALALHVGNALFALLDSLWLTLNALATPVLPLALCGFLLAIAANLIWLALLRRIGRPVCVNVRVV